MERDGARPAEDSTPLWARALLPLGAAFLGAARLKTFLYDRRLLRRAVLPAPAVSVGNLTFGGTGKTPVTLALTRLLRERGEHPAVLLRGYGRRTSAPLQVFPSSNPDKVGEEALLYVRSLPDLPVAVAGRREEGAALLASEAPTVFLLDDAFQHQRVARNLDLLVVDASRPGDLRTPPAGRLREPLSAASRARLLVVTRGEEVPAPLARVWGPRPLIRARFRWSGEPESAPAGVTWDALAACKFVAFAGIGHPASFFDQARARGLDLAAAFPFPDHAAPTAGRRAALFEAVRASGAGAVLTTEKDAVKWAPAWTGAVPLVWPRLEVEFDDPQGRLAALLEEALARRSP
ncbi:MAG: tetraacyldisaccharide 4'-kinase [Acidobacteriota bacterium]